MPTSIPQAKNALARSLRALIDPYPTKSEKNQIWIFFNNECAYCGVPLNRPDRKGHIDHLDALSSGGTNHLGNCILACYRCNGDLRRDSEWRQFLKSVAVGDLYTAREKKIEEWQRLHTNVRKIDPIAVTELNAAIRKFDLDIAEVAAALRGYRGGIVENEKSVIDDALDEADFSIDR
jgi:hypothetical protein